MNGRSGMMLLLAVVCGLGAMFGVRRMLSKEAPAGQTRPVLVAARDLLAEEDLKPEMVKVVDLPAASVPAGAFSDFREVEGRWIHIPMLGEEPIVDGKLAAKGTPKGIVGEIPAGMRAIAVEVNEQTGVSGFVLPKHRVDVVQARNPVGNQPSNNGIEAETILEDVLVLAAGTTIARPEDKSIQARTVTLALTPDQVDALVAAKSRGMLSLALRGLGDHKPARRDKAAPKAVPAVPTTGVLVATRDLKPGDALAGDAVAIKQLPADGVPPRAATSLLAVNGRRALQPIFAGEPILLPKLAEPGAAVVVEGARATLVAARDLAPGETIAADAVRVDLRPPSDRPAEAFARPEEALGQLTRGAIAAGEPIVPARVISPCAILGRGMRSFALEVDGETGGAGLLKPCDFVDIIWSGPKRTTMWGSAPRTLPHEVLLQDVLVIETARVRRKDAKKPEAAEHATGARTDDGAVVADPDERWVVTLAIPAGNIAEVAGGRATGTLTLARRADGDHARFAAPRTPSPLLGDVAIYRGAGRRNVHRVQVGGQTIEDAAATATAPAVPPPANKRPAAVPGPLAGPAAPATNPSARGARIEP